MREDGYEGSARGQEVAEALVRGLEIRTLREDRQIQWETVSRGRRGETYKKKQLKYTHTELGH